MSNTISYGQLTHSYHSIESNQQFDQLVIQSRICMKTSNSAQTKQQTFIIQYIDTFEPLCVQQHSINTTAHHGVLFNELSNDILSIILSFLTVTELIQIRSVNTTIRRLIFNPSIWLHAINDITNTLQGTIWYLLLMNTNTRLLKLFVPAIKMVTMEESVRCHVIKAICDVQSMPLSSKLSTLELSGYICSDFGCATLVTLTQSKQCELQRLIIRDITCDARSFADILVTIGNMPKTANLVDLGEYECTTYILKHLHRMKSLRELNITITSSTALIHIQQFTHLYRLRLRINVVDTTMNIRQYIQQLQSVSNVRILGVRGIDINT